MKSPLTLPLVFLIVTAGALHPLRAEDEVLKDPAGVIALTNPPVTKLSRKLDRSPGYISLSDALGNFVRIEILNMESPEAKALFKNKNGSDQAPILFDGMYYKYTYGQIKGVKEVYRSSNQEIEDFFVVGLFLKRGSILSENGERMDATRFVASYPSPPFMIYVTTEFNSFNGSGLSDEEMQKKALENLRKLKASIKITVPEM